ncbi:MAG: lycopene cyclase family protein [Chitinophagaceae bacterium]
MHGSKSSANRRSQGYDFIFLGAGCASLSLLLRMIRSGQFNDKKILLIDKAPKTTNDRTWCFWENKKGFFEEVVYRRWDNISFLSPAFSSAMNIAPYQYKMVRGIDFYNYCFAEIAKHSNIEVLYAEIDKWVQYEDGVTLVLNGKPFLAGNPVVFNSIYKPAATGKKNIKLLQHFKGWVIQTEQPSFKPGEATMMDFRVHQKHGTTFAYVLPFTPTTALVEYTLFTKELLPPPVYDAELKEYIQTFLGIREFDVTEEEFGIIPMTNERFSFYRNGAYQLGTAGGQTKASSGYTFQFIQKQSEQIVQQLIAGKPLSKLRTTPGRFRFYDNTLLHILYHNKLPGDMIFTRLFQKNKPQQVLRFLDNETSLKDELKIISTLPIWPFLKAAINHGLR